MQDLLAGNGKFWMPQVDASRITGIPGRTIRDWVSKGAIAVGEGSFVDVVELLNRDIARLGKKLEKLEGKQDESDPQRRLTIAQARKVMAEAQLREWELQQFQANFIEFGEAVSDVKEAEQTIRSKLAPLPELLAEPIAATNDPKIVAQLLTDAIHQALREVSQEIAELV